MAVANRAIGRPKHTHTQRDINSGGDLCSGEKEHGRKRPYLLKTTTRVGGHSSSSSNINGIIDNNNNNNSTTRGIISSRVTSQPSPACS